MRTRPRITPVVLTYAVTLGHLCGLRGKMLLQSPWVQLLDRKPAELNDLASEASSQGWINYKTAGGVVEITLPEIPAKKAEGLRMSRIDQLRKNYQRLCGLPWDDKLAGSQRVWIAVYDKEDERKLRLRIGLFEEATHQSGHRWQAVDLTNAFPDWLCSPPYSDYASSYFESPTRLGKAPLAAFKQFVAQRINQRPRRLPIARRNCRRGLRRGLAFRVRAGLRGDPAGRIPYPGPAARAFPGRVRAEQLPHARRSGWLELPRDPDHQ